MSKTQRILSIDTNSKTVKGQKKGYLTGIVYLAPHKIAGFNICPMAEIAGCLNACLYTAGRGVFNSVQTARINKTKFFHSDLQSFMTQLAKDIKGLIRRADRLGLIPLVRLNGTSDIRYENIKFDYEFMHGKIKSVTLFELFPEIQFYDYTKISNRKNIPANYDLTFSFSNTLAYRKYALEAFKNGLRIAVVFRNKNLIPAMFMSKKVINGDDSDIRHVEPQNTVVALYAKGKAKKDYSGFVVDSNVIELKLVA